MELRRSFVLLAVLIACCLLFATSAAGRFPALEMAESGDDEGWSDRPGTNKQWEPPEHCGGAEQLEGSPPESDSSPEDGSDSLSIDEGDESDEGITFFDPLLYLLSVFLRITTRS